MVKLRDPEPEKPSPAQGGLAANWQEPALTKRYYLVSDLHMGGDGQCSIATIGPSSSKFLKELANEDPDTELLIVGDTFGFWELTLMHGLDKLEHISGAHEDIFDQLELPAPASP